MIGRVIDGEYNVLAVVGTGAFSVVYRCEDMRLCRTVALKMLNRATTEDRDIRRFFAESRNLAALNHPNVIQIYRLGEYEDAPYIVMEYLTGQTLRELFRDRPPSCQQALEMMRQVAGGLAAIHGQGILHRDLSTNNIMITSAGQAKILDLGLSKDTRVPPSVFSENLLAGTISYVAPELVRGEAASTHSDIFSFGVILYEALTGRNPFQAEHVTATLYNTITRAPESLATMLTDAPAGLSDLTSRCLAKQPADRPESMEEIEEALGEVLARMGERPAAPMASVAAGRVRFDNPYLNRVMIKRTDDFFGRVQETKRIFSRLNATPPGSISVVGERKIGKSSLLNHVYTRSVREAFLQEPERMVMVYLDFQQEKSMSLPAFVNTLLGLSGLELRGRLEMPACSHDLEGIRDFIQHLDQAGFRLVLLLDEFETITTNPNFSLEFFSFLRFLANHYNVAYLTSSARDLQDLCHTKEISDSPFFNIFSTMRVTPFRPDEADELIRVPSARAGKPLEKYRAHLVEMAGLFPFFLQIACSQTLEWMEENPGREEPEFREIGRRFYEEAKFHYRYMWDGLDDGERSTLLRLARGKDIPASMRHVLDALERRSFVVMTEERQQLFASTFASFVREQAGSREGRSLFDVILKR